jgi:hypothetical protein
VGPLPAHLLLCTLDLLYVVRELADWHRDKSGAVVYGVQSHEAQCFVNRSSVNCCFASNIHTRNGIIPSIDRHAEEIEPHFADMNRIFEDFPDKLRVKRLETQKALEEVLELLGEQGN